MPAQNSSFLVRAAPRVLCWFDPSHAALHRRSFWRALAARRPPVPSPPRQYRRHDIADDAPASSDIIGCTRCCGTARRRLDKLLARAARRVALRQTLFEPAQPCRKVVVRRTCTVSTAVDAAAFSAVTATRFLVANDWNVEISIAELPISIAELRVFVAAPPSDDEPATISARISAPISAPISDGGRAIGTISASSTNERFERCDLTGISH